jgi:diacylglycerol kinase (ATP)
MTIINIQPKKFTGFKRVLWATFYSYKGFHSALRHEVAFRQEFIVDFTAIERFMLIVSMVAVMVVELINSAIESTLDRISLEHHLLTGRAKDYGSLAVLLTLIMSIAAWTLLLWPRLF